MPALIELRQSSQASASADRERSSVQGQGLFWVRNGPTRTDRSGRGAYRNGWSGKCQERSLVRQNERGMFCGCFEVRQAHVETHEMATIGGRTPPDHEQPPRKANSMMKWIIVAASPLALGMSWHT